MDNSIAKKELMSPLKRRVIIGFSIILSLIVFAISNSYGAFYERLISLNANIPLVTKIAFTASPYFGLIAFLIFIPVVAISISNRFSVERRAQLIKVIPIYFYSSAFVAIVIIFSMYAPIFVI